MEKVKLVREDLDATVVVNERLLSYSADTIRKKNTMSDVVI